MPQGPGPPSKNSRIPRECSNYARTEAQALAHCPVDAFPVSLAPRPRPGPDPPAKPRNIVLQSYPPANNKKPLGVVVMLSRLLVDTGSGWTGRAGGREQAGCVLVLLPTVIFPASDGSAKKLNPWILTFRMIAHAGSARSPSATRPSPSCPRFIALSPRSSTRLLFDRLAHLLYASTIC